MKWHNRFLKLASEVATWSKDKSTQVGAVIVEDKRIIATGYNGVPACIEDKEEYYAYPLKETYIIHAEMNAIFNASKGIRGMTLYCTHTPCARCAPLLVQAGITKIITYARDDSYTLRWSDSIATSKSLFKEANVNYLEI
jgi:dCMP deaminase